jgi:hypothetical protein
MKRIVCLFFCVLFGLLFIQIDTYACGCSGRTSDVSKEVIQDFNASSLVFSGKVVETKWIPIVKKNASGERIKAEVLTLKFAVDNWWKGKNKKEVIWQTSSIRYPDLNSGETGSNCEFSFLLGRKYLVYAANLNGNLTADVCGGTTRIENAESDIKELQKLQEVKKNKLSKSVLNNLINDDF